MPEYLETTVDKFILRVATDRLYSRDGIWLLAAECGGSRHVRVGLSDYVQQRSGDAAFVHVKTPGTRLAPGDEFAELETIKATLSLVSPLAAVIAEVNPALERSPERVNEDPYGGGWLAVMQPTSWEADRARLLDPDAYLLLMRSEAEEALKDS